MSGYPSILITGGASGLGLALAYQAGRKGYRVAIADIHRKRGEEALSGLSAEGIQALFCQCDVRNEIDIRNAINRVTRRWGQLSVMVNNAGVASAGPFESIPAKDWDWIMDINLMGAVRGSRLAVTEMKRQGHGHIINIASMAGLTPPPSMSAYNTAKGALVSFSESIYVELAPLNIHVSVICPTFFRTNLGDNLRTPDPVSHARFERLLRNPDLSAEEIAATIMQALDSKEFLIIPQKQARSAWRQKRWFPKKFYQAMIQIAGKMRRQ